MNIEIRVGTIQPSDFRTFTVMLFIAVTNKGLGESFVITGIHEVEPSRVRLFMPKQNPACPSGRTCCRQRTQQSIRLDCEFRPERLRAPFFPGFSPFTLQHTAPQDAPQFFKTGPRSLPRLFQRSVEVEMFYSLIVK